MGDLGQKRIAFADFLPILAAVKADNSATGCKEDYIEGLKVFDKESTGKVPLGEVANCLCSLGEKLEADEADRLMIFSISRKMRMDSLPTEISSPNCSPSVHE